MQGKADDQAARLLQDAKAIEAAGAFALVLEAIPADLAKSITHALSISTIGIGAGPHCDGQVLVLYDLLGLFDEFTPKFVKPYAHLKTDPSKPCVAIKKKWNRESSLADSESYH